MILTAEPTYYLEPTQETGRAFFQRGITGELVILFAAALVFDSTVSLAR